MSRRARSFEVRSGNPGPVVEAMLGALEAVPRAVAGVVFISGALLEKHEQLARLLSSKNLGIPVLIAGGTGVLSERGELEGQSAATGLIWSGGTAGLSVIPPGVDDEQLQNAFGRLLEDAGRCASVALFVPPGALTPRSIRELGRQARGAQLFGGGAVGDVGVLGVSAAGEILRGRAVALWFRGFGQALVRTTYSCKLLGPLRPITRARGPLVLELGREPALDVLTHFGQKLAGQPLVFTVLAAPRSDGENDAHPELLVRGVQGIDPQARGLVVSDEISEGMLMSFGVRDARASQEDLARVSRELQRDCAGAAPLCALYVNCAGRGQALYGRANVDTRLLRERLGEVPLAGMHSAFEIAPHGDVPSFQLYTGVIALLAALS
jgi:small ligand-binding sensory domain FIST